MPRNWKKLGLKFRSSIDFDWDGQERHKPEYRGTTVAEFLEIIKKEGAEDIKR